MPTVCCPVAPPPLGPPLAFATIIEKDEVVVWCCMSKLGVEGAKGVNRKELVTDEDELAPVPIPVPPPKPLGDDEGTR